MTPEPVIAKVYVMRWGARDIVHPFNRPYFGGFGVEVHIPSMAAAVNVADGKCHVIEDRDFVSSLGKSTELTLRYEGMRSIQVTLPDDVSEAVSGVLAARSKVSEAESRCLTVFGGWLDSSADLSRERKCVDALTVDRKERIAARRAESLRDRETELTETPWWRPGQRRWLREQVERERAHLNDEWSQPGEGYL